MDNFNLEREMDKAIAAGLFERSPPTFQQQLDHRAYDLARFAFYHPPVGTVSTVQSLENAIAVYVRAVA